MKPSDSDAPDASPTDGEAQKIEFVDAETDNPWDDFEAELAARMKKVNEKPKIIVVEEMDLNDISELFLLRSRVAFLESHITTSWEDRQSVSTS